MWSRLSPALHCGEKTGCYLQWLLCSIPQAAKVQLTEWSYGLPPDVTFSEHTNIVFRFRVVLFCPNITSKQKKISLHFLTVMQHLSTIALSFEKWEITTPAGTKPLKWCICIQQEQSYVCVSIQFLKCPLIWYKDAAVWGWMEISHAFLPGKGQQLARCHCLTMCVCIKVKWGHSGWPRAESKFPIKQFNIFKVPALRKVFAFVLFKSSKRKAFYIFHKNR